MELSAQFADIASGVVGIWPQVTGKHEMRMWPSMDESDYANPIGTCVEDLQVPRRRRRHGLRCLLLPLCAGNRLLPTVAIPFRELSVGEGLPCRLDSVPDPIPLQARSCTPNFYLILI